MAGFERGDGAPVAGRRTVRGQLDPDWQIAGKLNGGYLLALAGRAALTELGDGFPHPLAASAHYLASPEVGPAELTVQVLRRGRRTAQTRVSLSTEAGPCVEALVTCGQLDPARAVLRRRADAGAAAGGRLPRLPVEGPGFQVPLMGVVAERLDPAMHGLGGGQAERAWRAAGATSGSTTGTSRTTVALLAVVDALPPATFDLGVTGWVPTLELTCHVRAVPAPGALVVRQRARLVTGGRVDEECDVWDSTGRLVATGHQLAGVRHP